MKKLIILVSCFVLVVIVYGVYNAQHSNFPDSPIPPNMAKKAIGWGAEYGSNRVSFATEADLQIFQAMSSEKQKSLIITNTSCTVHFTTQAGPSTTVIPAGPILNDVFGAGGNLSPGETHLNN